MKKKIVMTVLAVSVLFQAGNLTAWAEESIKGREENQQDRIAQGINSGQLTAPEAAKLERGEAKIEKDREKAWADGKMTPKEHRKLEREENKESKRIHAAKHNRRKS